MKKVLSILKTVFVVLLVLFITGCKKEETVTKEIGRASCRERVSSPV